MTVKYSFLILCLAGFNRASSQEMQPMTIDSQVIGQFFAHHQLYAKYQAETEELYTKHPSFFWYNGNSITEFGVLLYQAADKILEEGLRDEIPYRKELDKIFKAQGNNTPTKQSDLLLTCLYFYYTDNVFGGLPVESSKKTGWNLPRKRENYFTLLAAVEAGKAEIISKKKLFNQYYQLKKALQKYLKIADDGGWDVISADKNTSLNPDGISPIVAAVRQRLFIEGYLTRNTSSDVFDKELLDAVAAYQEKHGISQTALINDRLITSLNVPIKERIESIAVNMERCRWISPETETDYIAVNIPSFKLYYFRDEEIVFTSKVVVGKEMNKTVVFSGTLNQVIFNPYWNVPSSILKKEILPALKKNPNYLKQHHMEWHQGNLRQRPGNDNALGKVKFLFPNSNNIYLHDTPQKTLFKEEKRTFSHGCIRVEKACELAALLMEENFGWTEMQTIQAMQQDSQKGYKLKKQLPVYIVYFTAWADQTGNVSFFPDVYQRDKGLAEMLFGETAQ